MMRVIVHHNSTPIKTYQFTTESVTVGRLATNTIPINSMGVSRHHLRIERDAASGRMFAQDLDSLNGSFINNQKITRMAFASGTEIILGKYSLTVEFTDEQPEQKQIPAEDPQVISMQQVEEQFIPEPIAPAAPAPAPAQSSMLTTSIPIDASVTSEHSSAFILDELKLVSDNNELYKPYEDSELPVVTTSDELELMEDNSEAISFAEPQANIIQDIEDTSVAAGNFVFTSSAPSQKKSAADPEELDPTVVNAVLIDLNRQVIYKINKTRMTFGSDKSADIFVESGVFSSDNLATLTVEESSFLITKGNGKLKVNEKKVPSHILSHKDKIKIDNSEFSFMIKDNG